MSKELVGVNWLLNLLNEIEFEYEDYENLMTLNYEIEKDHEAVVKELDKFIGNYQKGLFEKGICPVCGGAIVNERNSAYDTYVPYGSTYVCESEGYDVVCECCGYRGE